MQRKSLRSPEFSSFVILCVISTLFYFGNKDFLSAVNISNILSFLPELGLIALAMTLLLTAGEFDLSVGAVFALCPVMMALLVQNAGMDFGLALLLGLVVSAFVGLVNGLLVTKIGISSFLVTLSMLLVVRGTALFLTQGFPLRALEVDNFLVSMLAGEVHLGPIKLYASLFWFALFALASIYVLNVAKIGNWICAIGSNQNAALARGVPADKVKIGLFVATSLAAALAGTISALRIHSTSPVAGTAYELEVIAMVVVGGTALTGGRGTIIGTLMGVFILRIIRNGIVLIGVPGLAYNIFVGAIILGMLMLHAGLQRGQLRR